MFRFFSLCLSLALFSNVAIAQDNFYDALQGVEALEDFLPKGGLVRT